MKFIIRLIKALLNKDSNSNKYPHEIFPEILEWKKGDKIERESLGSLPCTYIGVNEQGIVFYKNFNYESYTTTVKKIKRYHNISLQNRNVGEKQKSIQDYSQFIKDFQKAYYEINK